MTTRPQVLAFDVIETLFNLAPLRRHFTDGGLPQGALETWFAVALRDMFALAAAESYAPMKDVLGEALDEICAKKDHDVDKHALLMGMGQLPPHPDVAPGLRALKDEGFRMITITNGAKATTEQLLEIAGLRPLFETLVSTDEVGRVKPDPKVYLHAVGELRVEPKDVLLIASHPWDIHGARSAGLNAAYLNRGTPFPHYMQAPNLTAASLTDLAGQCVKLESSGAIPPSVEELAN